MDTNYIKQSLSIETVAERYGVSFNNGKGCCIFHLEKTPSASFKDNKYHCFGCGLHLDIIDFTMHLFHISFSQALVRLNADFGLGLSNERPDRREMDRLLRIQSGKNIFKEDCKNAYIKNTVKFRTIRSFLLDKNYVPSNLDSEEYITLYKKLRNDYDYLLRWLDENISIGVRKCSD